MDSEQRARIVQALEDGKILLEYWSNTVMICQDCKKLVAETQPYLNGLLVLLRELGAA